MLTEKLRPKRLDDLRNQPTVVGFLKGWLKLYGQSGTSDAFLISGPSGSGKTSIAHALAGELGVKWGFHVVQASECNAKTVRDLADRLPQGTLDGSPWMIVLVDEAHTMTPVARDAWLSVLENLPRFRLVIFTTTEPQAFSEIWASRCKRLTLTRHGPSALSGMLGDAARAQGFKLSPALADLLALEANGNARSALHALEMHLLSGASDAEALGALRSARSEREQKAAAIVPVTDELKAKRRAAALKAVATRRAKESARTARRSA